MKCAAHLIMRNACVCVYRYESSTEGIFGIEDTDNTSKHTTPHTDDANTKPSSESSHLVPDSCLWSQVFCGAVKVYDECVTHEWLRVLRWSWCRRTAVVWCT